MDKEIIVNDFYEAAYLLLNQCQLVNLVSKEVGSRIICELTMKGADISQKHITYLNGAAEANILNLRRMVNQVHIWAYSSRKKFKKQAQQQRQGLMQQQLLQSPEVSHEPA